MGNLNTFTAVSRALKLLSSFFTTKGFEAEYSLKDGKMVARDVLGYRYEVTVKLLSRTDTKDFDETPYLDVNLNSLAKTKKT